MQQSFRIDVDEIIDDEGKKVCRAKVLNHHPVGYGASPMEAIIDAAEKLKQVYKTTPFQAAQQAHMNALSANGQRWKDESYLALTIPDEFTRRLRVREAEQRFHDEYERLHSEWEAFTANFRSEAVQEEAENV